MTETRKRIRDRLLAEGEYVPAFTWRALALTAIYPQRGLRLHYAAFRRWACLPGDRFEDFQRGVVYTIRAVKPRYLEVTATPLYGPSWDERVPRSQTYTWLVVR